MARKAFANPISEAEVSIAIERLLIANYPTAWTPGRISDLASPPSGFYDLGAVVEDTPSLKVTKDIFQLKTGIPAVVQYQAVTGLDAEFSVSLHSNSWRKAQVALGNYSYASSYTVVTSIASIVSQFSYTVAGSTFTESLVVGRQVVIASGTNHDNIDAMETRISCLSTVTQNIQVSPVPPSTPALGMSIAYYNNVRQYYGTSLLRNYVLLGVADFIDGVQVVHHIPKVQSAGETTEEIRPGQNQRIPLKFNAFGVVTAISSVDQLVVAERHYFPTLTT